MTTLELPLPSLSKGRFASIDALTDEPLFENHGIRIAFTERGGGVGVGAFASLNLGDQVGDDSCAVEANRARLMAAFGASGLPCVVPRQVHGDRVLVSGDGGEGGFAALCAQARQGADAVVIEGSHTAALLCFADCVPVIGVSPSGRFTVVHAGWRGVANGVAVRALEALAACDREAGWDCGPPDYNIYIGPHIRSECFETAAEPYQRFGEDFGKACLAGAGHVDLAQALKTAFGRLGAASRRILDAGVCTACDNEHYFSYRAQNGVCGRQGAFAIRLAGAS